MKVFIIGPEGAGKTLFAIMLNHHMSQKNNSDFVFREGDYITKNYLGEKLKTLQKGEWPPSTKIGKLNDLNWSWEGSLGKIDFSLTDPPGQDIRSELTEQSSQHGIVEKITSADIVTVMVDIMGHQSDSDEKKIQNVWIIERALQINKQIEGEGKRQKVLFLVSKADLLPPPFGPADWQNSQKILDLVKEYMPEFKLESYKNQLLGSSCAVLAFSSVFHTENRIISGPTASEHLAKFPKKETTETPLESRGLEAVSGHILDVWKRQQNAECIKEIMKRIMIAGMILAGFVVIYILYYFVRSTF